MRKASHGWWLPLCRATFVVLCSSAVGDHVLAQVEGKQSLERQFLNEAPAAWEAYRSSSVNLQGKIERSFVDDGKIQIQVRFEIAKNLGCGLFLTHYDNSNGKPTETDTLVGHNRDYSFKISRTVQKKDWVLNEVAVNKAACARLLQKNSFDEHKLLLQSLVLAHTEELSDLLKQQNFKIIAAVRTPDKGGDLIRIDFSNPHPLSESGKPFFPIQQGTMILDAKHSWILRHGVFECKYGDADSSVIVENEIDGSMKFPIPRKQRSTAKLSSPSKTWTKTITTDFDLYEPSSLPPDSKFWLTEFGLPEPLEFTRATKSQFYLWSIGGGAALLVVLAITVRRRRRK